MSFCLCVDPQFGWSSSGRDASSSGISGPPQGFAVGSLLIRLFNTNIVVMRQVNNLLVRVEP
jgi:hypothetical protein